MTEFFLEYPEVLATLVAAVVAVLHYITMKYRVKTRRLHIPDTLEATRDIYDTMLDLLQQVPCARILLVRTTNGGKLARPGFDLYSSVVFEVRQPDVPSIRDSWQGRRMDAPYQRMLLDVYIEDAVWVEVPDMADEELRDQYIADGLQHAFVLHVHSNTGALFYLCIGFPEGTDVSVLQDNPKFRAKVRGSVSKLRKALKEGDDVY